MYTSKSKDTRNKLSQLFILCAWNQQCKTLKSFSKWDLRCCRTKEAIIRKRLYYKMFQQQQNHKTTKSLCSSLLCSNLFVFFSRICYCFSFHFDFAAMQKCYMIFVLLKNVFKFSVRWSLQTPFKIVLESKTRIEYMKKWKNDDYPYDSEYIHTKNNVFIMVFGYSIFVTLVACMLVSCHLRLQLTSLCKYKLTESRSLSLSIWTSWWVFKRHFFIH